MIKKENIKNVLEYILLVFLFFIGLKKGGYYKQDELILVYFIQIILGIYFSLCFRNFKNIKNTDILFFTFSLSYFLALFFIPATMSGALNTSIKIYTMYLIYLIVSRSRNKEKFINAIAIFTVIFSIIGIDEIGIRILDKPLRLIGSGYLEYEGKISSILQYSNLLGLLCIISIIYLKDKLLKENSNNSNVKKVLINTINLFLGITLILTQSKMAFLLYILSSILICILKKNYKYIIYTFFEILCAFILSVLILKYNVYLVITLGLICYFGINYVINKIRIKNADIYILGLFIILNIVFLLCNTYILNENEIILRFKEYFISFDSTISRFTYYMDALKLSTNSIINFLVGQGGNAFRTLYETVQQQQYISMEIHSSLIQILLESGILGLVNFLALIIFVLVKSKNDIYKFILVIILAFSCFDVFFTYTYMLFILAIIIGLCSKEECKIKMNNVYFGINVAVYFIVLVINTFLIIGYIIAPVKVDNLNLSLQDQQTVMNKCELALKFDRFDLNYISNYNVACKTYLEIMDIKKELYGQDDEEKRKEVVYIIQDNINKELEYEKSNKYVYKDYIYYVCEYLDYMVQNDYSYDLKLGYEIYLENLMNILRKLKLEHGYNDYAMQIYYDGIEMVYYEYSRVNLLINSDKINSILTSIEENISISL